MSIWKTTGGAVAALGALALVVAWTPGVHGQQVYTFKSGDAPRKLIVQEREPGVLAKTLAAQLGGGVRLGVSIRDLTPEDVTKHKLPGLSGVMVEDVEKDSAAAKGGVVKGDVATGFDGEAVRSAAQFTRLVRESVSGRSVKLTVLREGKRVDLTVAPAEAENQATWFEREDSPARPADPERRLRREFSVPGLDMRRFDMDVLPGPMNRFRFEGPDSDVFTLTAGKGRLGVTVQDLNPELAEFFGVKDGALVASVQKDSPAAKAGVKAGDVITAIDGKAIAGPDDVVAQVREKTGELTVTVMRDRKAVSLKATIEKPAPQKPKVVIRGIGA